MILGCCIFYDDGPELLRACLESLKKVTDKVIAIDGAYAEFPHKDFHSQEATLAVARELADELIEAKEPWKDEAIKRNAYLKLRSEKDYYFFLDADEVAVGEKPSKLVHPVYRIKLETQKDNQWLPGYYNRLFRHHKGMRYHLKHNNLLTKDGLCLSAPEDHIPIFEGLIIKHTPEKRPMVRNEQDGEFERIRAENLVDMPARQKTPMDGFEKTPIQLRYVGADLYRGYDGDKAGEMTPMLCRQGDLVFVSQAKAKQLQRDFPKDWVLIKDLRKD